MHRPLHRLSGLLLCLVPAVGWAQESPPDFASPFLAPGHWAVGASRRLDALGLLGAGYDSGNRTPTRRQVAVAFERAVRAAEKEQPEYFPLALAYRDRYAEELPQVMAAVAGEAERGLRLGDGAAVGGFEVREGQLRPGAGYENGEDWTGPEVLDDIATAAGGASWSAQLFPAVAGILTPALRGGDITLGDGYATGVWRSVGLWLGRRPIGYSRGVGGGVVLNGGSPFDGGGIYLADPVTLPSFLRHVGPVHFEMFLSRVEDSGRIDRPWFWGARGAVAPHPRLDLGITRAAMFGGEDENDLSLKNLVYLIIGKHGGAGSQFDNQIFAVDVWYRPPLGILPLAVYLQWGFEDSAGAWRDTPGVVVGAEVPALPGLPAIALGLERTSFSESCCGNPIWYRHWWFDRGWTDGGVPLGHPLGGHGSQWLAWAHADLNEARVRLDTSLFFRDRGAENLFAPDREGDSLGVAVGVAYRPIPFIDLLLRGALESATNEWSESGVFAGGRVYF